jgi:1-deoxy-D-xylulose-5-phosphate reductoisomerase
MGAAMSAGPQRKGLVVLGSTGSIGAATLDVVARHPERFEVVALTAHHRTGVLIEQCLRFRPKLAVTADAARAAEVARALSERGVATEVAWGCAALEAAARHEAGDIVMAAIVGAAGLEPTLAAVDAGRRVLLANKESLVMAGALFMRRVARSGAVLLPIDSEHNAVYQCLPPDSAARRGVRRVLLTASGGPFRSTPAEALARVTPEQACAHPNWVMGRKISVDSATMMNKGLEVIEAHWLFGLPPEAIEVIVHPQSIVHSMVEYLDGSILAQLGTPDMRTPIAHALGFPERIDAGVDFLELARGMALDFERPDLGRFPCLRLGYQALRDGGLAPAVLNAANEVAVARFLDRQLAFDAIPRLIDSALERVQAGSATSLDAVLDADARARAYAAAWRG